MRKKANSDRTGTQVVPVLSMVGRRVFLDVRIEQDVQKWPYLLNVLGGSRTVHSGQFLLILSGNVGQSLSRRSRMSGMSRIGPEVSRITNNGHS